MIGRNLGSMGLLWVMGSVFACQGLANHTNMALPAEAGLDDSLQQDNEPKAGVLSVGTAGEDQTFASPPDNPMLAPATESPPPSNAAQDEQSNPASVPTEAQSAVGNDELPSLGSDAEVANRAIAEAHDSERDASSDSADSGVTSGEGTAAGDTAVEPSDAPADDNSGLSADGGADSPDSAPTRIADGGAGPEDTLASEVHDSGPGSMTLDPDAATPPPLLSALDVVGIQGSLNPAFNPQRLRYSVRAEQSLGHLVITASVADSLTVSINGNLASSDAPIALPEAVPGTTLEVVVRDNRGESTVYSLSYLPSNFPELVVTAHEPTASDDPLYVTLYDSTASYLAKLDNYGVPYFYQGFDVRVVDFKKHPSGELSYALWEDPNFAGATQVVLDPEFHEIKRLKTVGLTNTDMHDFIILPNGNYMLMSYEPALRDLSPFGGGTSESVQDSVFQELSPNLNVVFQWNSWDYLQYDHSYYAFGDHDYAHANSVVVDFDGNWIVSSRGLSQILKIDRITGDVIWRLGGVSNQFTFINDPFSGTCGQHTASRLDNGHILIFDNGSDCLPELMGTRNKYTRVVEYALDEVAMTAELVWSYSRPGAHTRWQGSAQRLDNGNTIIGWGNGPSLLTTEVDSEGHIVFELEARQPNNGHSVCYRSRRFAE